MRNWAIAAVVGVLLGVGGAMLWIPAPGMPPSEAGAEESARGAQTSDRPMSEPILQATHTADGAIVNRLAAVEAELRGLREAIADLTRREGISNPAPATQDASADDAHAVASADGLRARWRGHLDELEGRILAEEAREGANPVLDSHKDDLHRARQALTAAQTLDELKQLSTGEFKNVFKLH